MANKSKKKKWTNGGSASRENFIKLYVTEMINIIVNDKESNDVYAKFYSNNINNILDFFESQLENKAKLYDILLEVLHWEKIASIFSIEIESLIKNNCLATFAIKHIYQNYDIWYTYVKNLNNDMNNDIIYNIIAQQIDQSLEYVEFIYTKQLNTHKRGGNGMFTKLKYTFIKKPGNQKGPDVNRHNVVSPQKTILQDATYKTKAFSIPYESVKFEQQLKFKHIIQLITIIILNIVEEIRALTGKDIIDIILSNKNIKKLFSEKSHTICMNLYISTVTIFYRTDKNLPLIISYVKKNDEVIEQLCNWINVNDAFFKKLICKILKEELNLFKAISYFLRNVSASTTIAPIGIKLKNALNDYPELLKMFEKNQQYNFNTEYCPYKLGVR